MGPFSGASGLAALAHSLCQAPAHWLKSVDERERNNKGKKSVDFSIRGM